MTRDTILNESGGRASGSQRRVIPFEPSTENLAFLEAEKKKGIPYAFTIGKGVDMLRKKSAKA